MPLEPLAKALNVRAQALMYALGWSATRPGGRAWVQSECGLWLRPELAAGYVGSQIWEALQAEAQGPLGEMARAYRRWLDMLPPTDRRRLSPWGLAQWPLAAEPAADPAWACWCTAQETAAVAQAMRATAAGGGGSRSSGSGGTWDRWQGGGSAWRRDGRSRGRNWQGW